MKNNLVFIKINKLYRQIYLDLIKYISKEMEGSNSYFIGETSMMFHNSINIYVNNFDRKFFYLPSISIFCPNKKVNIDLQNKISDYVKNLYVEDVDVRKNMKYTSDFYDLISSRKGIDPILLHEFLGVDPDPACFYKPPESLSISGGGDYLKHEINNQIYVNKLFLSGLDLKISSGYIARKNNIIPSVSSKKGDGIRAKILNLAIFDMEKHLLVNIVSTNIEQDESDILYKSFNGVKIPYKDPSNMMDKTFLFSKKRLSNCVGVEDGKPLLFKQKFSYLTKDYPFYELKKGVFSDR